MCLAWAQLGVSMITRSMLVLSAGLLAAVVPLAGAAQAQSIFLLDEDPAAEQQATAEPEAQTDESAAAAQAPVAEPQPDAPTIFMNTAPSGNSGGGSGASSSIQPPEIGGGGRGAAVALNEPVSLKAPTVDELLRPENFGMTTTEYNKYIAELEAKAAKDPEAVANDPMFELEMLRTGEKLGQTYGRQISERCSMPTFSISVIPGDWTPMARNGLQQQAMGKISAALASACQDKDKKQIISNYAPIMMIQNQRGAGAPAVAFDNGVMVLRGDFTKSGDEINSPALGAQISAALVQVDKFVQPLVAEAEQMAATYGE